MKKALQLTLLFAGFLLIGAGCTFDQGKVTNTNVSSESVNAGSANVKAIVQKESISTLPSEQTAEKNSESQIIILTKEEAEMKGLIARDIDQFRYDQSIHSDTIVDWPRGMYQGTTDISFYSNSNERVCHALILTFADVPTAQEAVQYKQTHATEYSVRVVDLHGKAIVQFTGEDLWLFWAHDKKVIQVGCESGKQVPSEILETYFEKFPAL